jgi:hypothetical protein
MLARCRGAFLLFCLPLALLSAGCRNRSDLVEAELRQKDMLYLDALDKQRAAEARIAAQQQEIDALRKGVKITPEQAVMTYGLKRIVLGRGTGGYDHDNIPGDELLQVVVEPKDTDEHTIKSPGKLQIYALEITPQGLKVPLCMWDIPPEQLRSSWKQGLLSTGYTLTLPWKVLPVVENVRILVRLTTPDQRVYEADKDVKVRLVPGAAQKRPEMMPDVPPNLYPTPPPEGIPFIVPTGRVTTTTSLSPAPPRPITDWQPVTSSGLPAPPWQPSAAPAQDVITIGRPQPLDTPNLP